MKKLFFLAVSVFMTAMVVNAQDTLPKRDRMHQEEHLMLMDGKLYRMKNGVRSEVQSQVQLRNGGTINPDGSYQLKNKERMQLGNGECIDMDGNRYQNQKMFNQRHMMTHHEMMQHKDMNKQKNQMKQNKGTGKKN